MFIKKTVWCVLVFFIFSQSALALGERISKATSDISESVGFTINPDNINQEADAALKALFKRFPEALKLSKKSKAILVFPKIIKAGMGVGGHHGNGVLKKGGKSVAYYKTVAASYGLQIGAQVFGYAMFFMDDKALNYIDKKDGWEVGVGPSLVVVDDGMAKTLTTETINDDIYVFTFNQEGLMAGAGVQGSKISRIKP